LEAGSVLKRSFFEIIGSLVPQVRPEVVGGKKQNWVSLSESIRDKHGLPMSWNPLTTRNPPAALRGIPRHPRNIELLNIAECIRIKAGVPASGHFVNVSQSVAREPWGSMHCLAIGSLTYDTCRDQCLTGCDRLAMMGLPAQSIARALIAGSIASTERDLDKFSGQGMAAPCIGAVLFSVFLQQEGPWWIRRP
jgi:hypothetical protein